LNSFDIHVHLQNEIPSLDLPISILSEDESLNVYPNDFNISKTLILNHYYPSLDNLSENIEKIVLQIDKPIDLMGFGKYSSLKDLSITLKKSNIGLCRQILIPNLKKLTINLKGNHIDSFE